MIRFFFLLYVVAWSTLLAFAQEPLPKLPEPTLPVFAVVEERSTRVLAPGIELTTIRRNAPVTPLQLFIVKIDPRGGTQKPQWKLKVATAGYSVLKAAPTSVIAKQENAIVAINGGYFAFRGAALGAVKIDNEWIRLPWKNRTAMGIDEKGRILIDNLQAGASFSLRDGQNYEIASLPVSSLNGYAPPDGIAVVTRRLGTVFKPRLNESSIEVTGDLQNGVVTAKSDVFASTPDNGWAIVANGKARDLLQNVTIGQKAILQFSAPDVWQKYSTILGAGPRLLKNGEVFTTEKAEEFRPDVVARGPRTAFGVDKNGYWIFLAADGRQPEYSMGLTLPELARELQLVGATEAVCLDGGGSTALVVNGEVLNRPSDGSERRVPNALTVVAMEK